MSSLVDEQTSITDMVDGFVSYKINRYRTKLDHAVKRMRGEVVCDSDIIMADLLEPQYLVNSIQDKIIAQHKYIVEPFRQTYAIKEIKNVI
jgi:hypothetical protein